MKIEYELTLADFKAARALHRRQKFSRRLIPWAGPILLVISVIGFVVGSVIHNMQLASQSFALAVGALVFTIGIPVSNALGVRRSYSQLFHAGKSDRRSVLEINDEFISRRLTGMSELKVLWSGVYDVIQDKKIALIYTNKDCFLIIPMRARTPDEHNELTSLVARHLQERG
ncbi:MAG: YcxB family protein [Terracidiphilus sp.]